MSTGRRVAISWTITEPQMLKKALQKWAKGLTLQLEVSSITGFFISSNVSASSVDYLRFFQATFMKHLLPAGTGRGGLLTGMRGWWSQSLVLEESVWPLLAEASDPGFQKMNGSLDVSSFAVGAFDRVLFMLSLRP